MYLLIIIFWKIGTVKAMIYAETTRTWFDPKNAPLRKEANWRFGILT
jgi:hypothetical protein